MTKIRMVLAYLNTEVLTGKTIPFLTTYYYVYDLIITQSNLQEWISSIIVHTEVAIMYNFSTCTYCE